MPSDSAIERLSRVLDMIPMLANREMRAEDLAAKFGSDVETIRRDLEIAFLCGLPGYTPDLLIDIDLDGESISVLDPQVLDTPRQMGAEEVSILLFGLDMVHTVLPTSPFILRTIESLKSKISPSGDMGQVPSADANENHLLNTQASIERAMLEGRCLNFDYVDTLGTRSSRVVSCQRVFRRGNRLTLEAYDLDREDRRYFFISAMTNLVVSDIPAMSPQEIHPDSEQSYQARLIFKDLPRWWIRRHSAFIEEVGKDARGEYALIRYWKGDWLVRATVPIVDRFVAIEDPIFNEEEFRGALLRHISGS